MISLLGTSNMLGGHDKSGTDSDIMLHNILAKELNCDVLNLATPGRGTERYISNFLYAYTKYKPSMVVCELYIDRSFSNFWFPTSDTTSLFNESAEIINQSFIEERSSFKKDEIDNRYIKSRINRNTENKKHLNEFKNAIFHITSIERLLEYYKKSCVYIDEEHLCGLRTVDTMYSLETISQSLGINIMYVALFGPAIEFNKPFIDTLPPDRFLNNYFKIPNGIDKVLSTKCNGNYLSFDNDHFNEKADRLLVKDFIAPFVKEFALKNHIQL